MLGLSLALSLGRQQSPGGLSFSVATRGSDGTTATLRITGTLSMSVAARGSDGTTATLRII